MGLIWQNATALRPVLGPALDLGFVYRVFGFEVHAGEALAACGVMLLCAMLYLRAGGRVRHVHTFLAILLAIVLLLPTSWDGTSAGPESQLFLAVWIVLGLFVFRYVACRGDCARVRDHSPLVWMALFFLIFYCSAMWMRQAGQGATREACEHLAGHYETQLEAVSGHARDATHAAGDRLKLDVQMQHAVESLFARQLVQAGIVLCALRLLYGIFRTMRARERSLEMEMMRAEERSHAKSAFLFNISHDLRTPMNAIIGYTDLARRRRVSGEEMRAYLDKIGDASQHLLALINDTLEKSHIENGKLELTPADTDLRASVEDVCGLFASQIDAKGVSFEVDCRGVQRPYVKCDDSHFRRVVLNLVGNASKFTPAGAACPCALSRLHQGSMPASTSSPSGTRASACRRNSRTRSSRPSSRSAAPPRAACRARASAWPSPAHRRAHGRLHHRRSEQGRGTCFTVRLPLPTARRPKRPAPRPATASTAILTSRASASCWPRTTPSTAR